MPRKLLTAEVLPSLVEERLNTWGKAIRAQRMQQRITAEDLCTRLGVSRGTLRRLEAGDPGAGAGIYLTALLTLGLEPIATPALSSDYWRVPGQRVKHTQHERADAKLAYF